MAQAISVGDAKTYQNILHEVTDRVATITLNRPEKLNAQSRELREELSHAMHAADADDAVRCIVLTGAGKAFSSGGDISRTGGSPAQTAWDWYRFHQPGFHPRYSGRDVYKPVIAAVNGPAYGAGMIMLMGCDIVIASDKARFCMIEARMGNSGVSNLPFFVGPQWAKILMLTGEEITAKRAEKIGYVSLVVPHDQLMTRAMAFAKRIAAMPRYGVMLNKANIDGTMDMMGWAANQRFSNSHASVTDAVSMSAEGPDGRNLREIFKTEGIKAFVAARDAAFGERLFPEDE